jgi:NAD(P)-dependent dehydrogenase (short-subunit alcohol dehydrogenase family)
MEIKNILVTGVSRGLGIQVVKSLLADSHYCVYGVSRSMTPELEMLLSVYPIA